MNQLKNKLFDCKYIRYFAWDFVSLIIFWGGMLRKSFTSDTISHMVASDADVLVNIEQGRYIKALGDYLLLKIGLRTTTNLSVTILCAFVLLAMTMVILQMAFSQWEPTDLMEKVLFNATINFWVYNVLFVENLIFSEVSVYFALAYLGAAIAVACYTKRKYLCMLIALGVSACAYQYAVCFAAIYLVFYIFLCERKLSLRTVKRELFVLTMTFGMGVLNLISIFVLVRLNVISHFFKSAGTGSVMTKLMQMMDSFVGLHKDASGIFPDIWLPLLVVIMVEVLLIIDTVKGKKYQQFLLLSIVSMGSCILLYIIPLAQEKFFFPPRMAFCFFAVQGMIMASAYVLIESRELRKILVIGCAGYLLVHLLFSNFTVTNHFVSNTLDKVYVRMTYEKIEKYERDTGNEVENLCVINDTDAPPYYDEVNYTSDQINERSIGILSVSIMEVVTGRQFNKVEMDEEVYKKYFEGKNWDYFDPEEQIVIIGDTVYWCVF